MKQKFQIVKKFLSNKKYRSATILGLYLIFFIFLGVMARNSGTKPVVENPLESFNKMDNYEYKLTYNDKIYKGIRYQNKELINQKYYIEDDIYYELKDNKKEVIDKIENIEFLNFRPNKIYKLITDGNKVNEVKYNDNTSKITYKINGAKLLFTDDSFKELDISIYLNTKVIKIEFDNVIIEYSNINNISDILLEI